jgi:hypothetical protein
LYVPSFGMSPAIAAAPKAMAALSAMADKMHLRGCMDFTPSLLGFLSASGVLGSPITACRFSYQGWWEAKYSGRNRPLLSVLRIVKGLVLCSDNPARSHNVSIAVTASPVPMELVP